MGACFSDCRLKPAVSRESLRRTRWWGIQKHIPLALRCAARLLIPYVVVTRTTYIRSCICLRI